MAHVDMLCKTDYLLNLLRSTIDAFPKANQSLENAYNVIFSGGSKNSMKDMVNVFRQVKEWIGEENGQVNLYVGPIGTKEGESLALDLKTGRVYRFQPESQKHLSTKNDPVALRAIGLEQTARMFDASISGKKWPKPNFPIDTKRHV